jgi:PAS domain S-box-containing protein
MANADGWIHWYNERWCQYTGTTIDQMRGWGWQSVHDPVELPKVMERWQASIATGEPFDMVFPLRGADGVFRPFLTRVMPVKNAEGRVVQWFGTNTDISEQKRTEDALRQSEARLKEAQHNAHIGSWMYRPGEPFTVSDELYELFKLPRDVVPTQKKLMSLVHPEDQARSASSFQRCLESGIDFELSYRVVWPDGQIRHLLGLGKVHRDDKGQLIDVVGTAQDLTERVLAEAELRESEDRYRDLVESSHDLICTHDLNGKLLSVNSAAAKTLGYEVSELLKIPLLGIIVPAFREQFDQYLVRMKERGADKGWMAVLTRAGEQRIWQYDNTLRTEGVSSPIVRGMAQDVTSAYRRRGVCARARPGCDCWCTQLTSACGTGT